MDSSMPPRREVLISRAVHLFLLVEQEHHQGLQEPHYIAVYSVN